MPGSTVPLDAHRSWPLPFRSKCNKAEPSSLAIATNRPAPSAAQSKVCKPLQPFATISCDGWRLKERTWIVASERLRMATPVPSGERSYAYSASGVGLVLNRVSSWPRPLTGSKAVKISCLWSGVRSAIAHKVAGERAQRSEWIRPGEPFGAPGNPVVKQRSREVRTFVSRFPGVTQMVIDKKKHSDKARRNQGSSAHIAEPGRTFELRC
jgi:hypothetical protein